LPTGRGPGAYSVFLGATGRCGWWSVGVAQRYRWLSLVGDSAMHLPALLPEAPGWPRGLLFSGQDSSASRPDVIDLSVFQTLRCGPPFGPPELPLSGAIISAAPGLVQTGNSIQTDCPRKCPAFRRRKYGCQ